MKNKGRAVRFKSLDVSFCITATHEVVLYPAINVHRHHIHWPLDRTIAQAETDSQSRLVSPGAPRV